MHDTGKTFQHLTDEAFANLLKKHKLPVAACRNGIWESVPEPQALFDRC
jgi:hypothetical protein